MEFIDIVPLPGLFTDQETSNDQGRTDPRWLKAHNYEWLAFQAYNPQERGKKDRNLQPTKDAGLHAGIWGATYGLNNKPDATAFYDDGQAMAEQAKDLGGEFIIVDGEDCVKETRGDRGCLPIVEGIRDGGWDGPVHLSQMGAPVNPRTAKNPTGNDYGCDEKTFLDTGGGIFPQEYANEDPSFEPALCKAYWLACGVPEHRLNHTIALYESSRTGIRISGSEWAIKLSGAKIGRNISLFMMEHLQPYDAEGLDKQVTLPSPLPPPPPPPSPYDLRMQIVEICDKYLSTRPGPETLSRLRVIRRIAQSSNTDSVWGNARVTIVTDMDALGMPK